MCYLIMIQLEIRSSWQRCYRFRHIINLARKLSISIMEFYLFWSYYQQSYQMSQPPVIHIHRE
jgi:hypothetical protein